MTLTPLNTRDCARSRHMLSILRPLLRRIALKHRDAAGVADEPLGAGVEAFDLESQNDHVTALLDATASSEQQRADSYYQSTPSAASLSEAELATQFAEGHDPWSEEAGTLQNGRLKRPPVRQLTVAARFLSMLPSEESVDELLAPRSCTHLIIAGSDRVSIVANGIEDVAKFLAGTTGIVGANWYDLEVLFDTAREDHERSFSRDRHDRFDASVRSRVRDGTTFLFVSSQTVPLPEAAEAVCDRRLHLPPLSHAHIIEILRYTH